MTKHLAVAVSAFPPPRRSSCAELRRASKRTVVAVGGQNVAARRLRQYYTSGTSRPMTSSMPARGRILVVDDDRGLRHAMATLLNEAGHVVVQAADGLAALGELGRTPLTSCCSTSACRA